MQKDIASGVGQALSEGLNRMNDKGEQSKSLMNLVKKQAEVIDKKNQLVMHMEESIKLQQENIHKLVEQNKYLESLVEALRSEREKMVEEINLLKSKPKTSPRRKTVAQDEAA